MKLPLVAGLFLLAAPSAHAQTAGGVRLPNLADLDHQDPAPAPRYLVSWGLHGGIVKALDADDASLTAGLHVLFRMTDFLGLEASLSTASSEFASGDAEVTWLPLRVTAKLYYKLATPTVLPYGLIGMGIVATDVEFSGSLGAFEDDESTELEFHLGAGVEVTLQDSRLFFSAEFRFVFQDPDVDALDDDDFNLLLFTVGLSYRT